MHTVSSAGTPPAATERRAQPVGGGAVPDGGLRRRRRRPSASTKRWRRRPPRSTTTMTHAVPPVGEDRALHGRHLLELGPGAVPDGLAVGLVECEAGRRGRSASGAGTASSSLRVPRSGGRRRARTTPPPPYESETLLPLPPHERGIGVGHVVRAGARLAPGHPQDGGVDDGTGRNESAGRRRPTSNDHQGAHVVESRVVGGAAARLRATSHCTTRSARPQATARVIEEVAQQGRGGTEGKRAHRPEGPARHPVAERVAADHRDVRQAPSPRLAPEVRRPAWIALERHDLDAARASANVQAPRPAPISTTRSPASKAASATRASARSGRRKF